MLWGRCGDGDSSDGDGVGWGQRLWGWGGDGYSVHGDGWGWGSVSVPVQTSNRKLVNHASNNRYTQAAAMHFVFNDRLTNSTLCKQP